MTSRRALVVGLGSAVRGDDALGLAVARLVAARCAGGEAGPPAEIEVIEQVDPTDLVDLWTGVPCVVVADAVRSGNEPGTVTVIDVGVEAMPPWRGSGGTHAFGLAAAVELGRALGRLPEQLLVVGIEPAAFESETGLSTPVRVALIKASDAVLAALQTAAAGGEAGPGEAGPVRDESGAPVSG